MCTKLLDKNVIYERILLSFPIFCLTCSTVGENGADQLNPDQGPQLQLLSQESESDLQIIWIVFRAGARFTKLFKIFVTLKP